jgi:nicotinate-nucleotide pyrophosphorylase (carboxylating)
MPIQAAAPTLADLVAMALAEDVGPGDLTASATVPEGARGRARVLQKEPGVVFGLSAAEEVLRQCGVDAVDRLVIEAQWRDSIPAEVLFASGDARGLLAAERTALNLLSNLSGVATMTARFVEAISGTGARILDTRKTTPGMRSLEKAAVAAGGGANHRMGLYDAILIKENHVALAGSLSEAVHRCRDAHPEMDIEVECRDLGEVEEALAAGADRLLLDNMEPRKLAAAVRLRGGAGSGVTFEASGGITLDTARDVAEAGVDFISVGALTHSAPALDLSMLIEPA